MDKTSLGSSILVRTGVRKYLTLLFSDLSESTKLAEQLEAEEYAELLESLHFLYEQKVSKHGGMIVRIQGDGMLAVFGYPSASENDGRRAVDSALEIRDAVKNIRPEGRGQNKITLGVHSGIHSGLVLTTEGDLVRGRLELHGLAPSVAARLANIAQSGAVLVSRQTLGPEADFYEITSKTLIVVKGLLEPLEVIAVTDRSKVRTRFEAAVQRGLTAFSGRKGELAELEAILAYAMQGHPAQVVISASPGVGKTRLAEEFAMRAATLGCEVHRGYCEPFLSAQPLQPFVQMLSRLGAAGTVLEKGKVEFLSPALFSELATVRPQVIIIDDWQWADKGSRQIASTIREIQGRPILLLQTARTFAPDDIGISLAKVINLGPLSDEEVASTIFSLLPHSDPVLTAKIQARAGGNPLFIEELCHAAVHNSTLRSASRASEGVAWVSTLIEARLARLTFAQADLVRLASVIGNVIPYWLIEDVTGLSVHDPIFKELSNQDFVFPDSPLGLLKFKHGIARDVIYESVGLQTRRAMHLRVAEAVVLRGGTTGMEVLYELLAYHFGAGGRHSEALRYAMLAAEKAVAVSALDSAQTLYRAALSALDHLDASKENYDKRMSITMRLSLAGVFDPSREQLIVLNQAIEQAEARGDLEATARAAFWLGYTHYALGESGEAIEHLYRALGDARTVKDEPLVVQIVATLGQAKAAACDYDDALVLLNQAIVDKRKHRKSGRAAVGSAYSLACKAAVLGDQGSFALAYECFDEALDVVQGFSHEVEGSILCWKSGVQLWHGRWTEAGETAELAKKVAERVKSLYVYSMSIALGAYASWKTMPSDESLKLLTDSTAWLEARNRGLFISLNYGWLADSAASLGNGSLVRSYAARALVRNRKKQDCIGQAMAARALAEVMASKGQSGAADKYLRFAFANARKRGAIHETAVTQLCQAQIKLKRGERGEAKQLFEAAQNSFVNLSMAWHENLTKSLVKAMAY